MKKIMQKVTPQQQLLLILISLAVIAGLFSVGSKKVPEAEPIIENPQALEVSVNWPSTEVRRESVDNSDGKRKINAEYPITKSESVNAYFKQYVDTQIKQFKDDTSWADDPEITSASESTLSLEIGYENQKAKMADNYIFTISSYTGGAHGLTTSKTFSFSKEGKLIAITDLFTNGLNGLKTISAYTQTQLAKREGTDSSWIADGASATTENYHSFIITDSGITILFDPYQVAAFAAGEQRVDIPLSVFRSVANKEYFTIQ